MTLYHIIYYLASPSPHPRWPWHCSCYSSSSPTSPCPQVLSLDTSSTTSTSIEQLLNFLLELRWFLIISRCSSKFYYDFSRCKLEREEAARRGLNRRSRQIHHNSASTGQEASLVVLALATLWTQKCLWWLFFGWGRVGWVWRKKVQKEDLERMQKHKNCKK